MGYDCQELCENLEKVINTLFAASFARKQHFTIPNSSTFMLYVPLIPNISQKFLNHVNLFYQYIFCLHEAHYSLINNGAIVT